MPTPLFRVVLCGWTSLYHPKYRKTAYSLSQINWLFSEAYHLRWVSEGRGAEITAYVHDSRQQQAAFVSISAAWERVFTDLQETRGPLPLHRFVTHLAHVRPTGAATRFRQRNHATFNSTLTLYITGVLSGRADKYAERESDHRECWMSPYLAYKPPRPSSGAIVRPDSFVPEISGGGLGVVRAFASGRSLSDNPGKSAHQFRAR